ncbi:MAG: group II intron reverse transcriptase/maturase [Victivallaceae bacterium]|nr:group II intron reverse transcriptase/maturase [Victivallaceae bacterium]
MIDKNLQKESYHLKDEEKVRNFQRKIYQKAKQEPKFRFYVLYDKVRNLSFISEAYRRVKANKGKPGVDGMSFDDIEESGKLDFLLNIIEELKDKTYRPFPVKRVMIPKANGKMRPLGIPIIKDRVVQMSCKMVIEPIFEADFENTSYGFRPKRNAKQAITKIKENLKQGKVNVYDADLSAYFDTIPHAKLLTLIALRISDKNIIHLIKMWLKAPINENGKISGGKKNKVGTPQGGVISPLLANIYLHLLDKLINNVKRIFVHAGVVIVRYADDYVLMGKKITASMMSVMMSLLNRMGLRINEEKSKFINAEKEPLHFLGFTIRYDNDIKGRYWKYWNVFPAEKSQKKIREKIKNVLKKKGHYSPFKISKTLNSITRGWINNFNIPKVSYTALARRKLRYYLIDRLHRYFKRKSQRKCKLYGDNAFQKLVEYYGLIDPRYYAQLAPANA